MKLTNAALKALILEAIEDESTSQKDSWKTMNLLQMTEYMQALRARVKSEIREIEQINQRLRKLGYLSDDKR